MDHVLSLLKNKRCDYYEKLVRTRSSSAEFCAFVDECYRIVQRELPHETRTSSTQKRRPAQLKVSTAYYYMRKINR